MQAKISYGEKVRLTARHNLMLTRLTQDNLFDTLCAPANWEVKAKITLNNNMYNPKDTHVNPSEGYMGPTSLQ